MKVSKKYTEGVLDSLSMMFANDGLITCVYSDVVNLVKPKDLIKLAKKYDLMKSSGLSKYVESYCIKCAIQLGAEGCETCGDKRKPSWNQ